MAQYTITISKVEKVMVDKEFFIGKGKPEADEFGYIKGRGEEERDKPIYQQSTDNEIDLKKIIDAFNEPKV